MKEEINHKKNGPLPTRLRAHGGWSLYPVPWPESVQPVAEQEHQEHNRKIPDVDNKNLAPYTCAGMETERLWKLWVGGGRRSTDPLPFPSA